MELRELAYQQRVLKSLDGYLDELVNQKAKVDKRNQVNVRQDDPDLKYSPLNFPHEAWKTLKAENLLPASRSNIPYSGREDGIGRPVPNIVYKVPTAGGKTYLAIASLSKIFNRYLGRSTGFVLWIVPNEAIYRQTKRQLSDRRHPYRQLLDNLSGNAVKLMEKTTSLHAADVESNLCVMLLMLQSSNRQNKETLKIFRERGDVHGFTPKEDNQLAHRKAVQEIPNLDTCDLADSKYPWMPVKDSLGNALRVIRPVVIMDEGHKAVSDLAFKTLYGFNPCFVLELTATPKDVRGRGGAKPRPARYQNLLVEVSGTELDREGMIKLPINLDSRQTTDWKITLKASLDRLNELDERAREFHADHNRYIRPIMLVQVERTGNDQRDGIHIHAEDVKDWLTNAGQLDEAEVAVKTSEKNDLKSPENQDLLSPSNRIRAIITKQALQEGWDCPFAYILCSLASSSSQSAMTQLIGRILRQPYARKTNVDQLDESYIITHHTETNQVVEVIKTGLEKDGMGDLVQSISIEGPASEPAGRKILRRKEFAKTEIFLPKVTCVIGQIERELDYEEDILYALDWRNVDVTKFVTEIPNPKDYREAERQLRKIGLADPRGERPIYDQYIDQFSETRVFDHVYTTRFISDVITNPWVAREILGKVVKGFHDRGFSNADMNRLAALINEQLREWLCAERDAMAEILFKDRVKTGRIRFHLHTNDDLRKINWEMPRKLRTHQPEGAEQLISNKGEPLQRSLFLPLYKGDMNDDESKIAVYMDDVETIKWWHRNVSRNHYYLQGWRRDKIYPDFICSVQPGKDGKEKLVVLEMKGEHLAGNEDTKYKEAMLELLTQSFSVDEAHRVGYVDLWGDGNISMRCELVLFSEGDTKLPDILQ